MRTFILLGCLAHAGTLAAPRDADSWLFRSTALDSDGDGIPDSLDACPHEAEDIDGYEDADGCPELTLMRFVFTDPEGLIESVQAEIDGIGRIHGAGILEVELPPGEYDLEVRAAGYRTLHTRFAVTNGPSVKIVRTLSPLPKRHTASLDQLTK